MSPAALIHFLRALSYVNLFGQDTLEFRAICHSVIEAGLPQLEFEKAVVQTVIEFHRAVVAGGPEQLEGTRLAAALARLFFLLYALSSLAIQEHPDALKELWPVLSSCAAGELQGDEQQRATLASSAHALLATALSPKDALQKKLEVRDYVSAALRGPARWDGTGAAVRQVLLLALEAIARQLGNQGEEATREAALELQGWMMDKLLSHASQEFREGRLEVCEGFFGLFCAVSTLLDPAALDKAQLIELLRSHPPLRAIWLRHLAARFPEGSRQDLIIELLKDFPEAARAGVDPQPAVKDKPPLIILRSLL